LRIGGTMPAVLNAANEEAVRLFLEEKIGFLEIPQIIERVMTSHTVEDTPDLDDIIKMDLWAREKVGETVSD